MSWSLFLVILLQILRSGLCGSSYGGVKVDRISGELVKPANMSEQRFQLMKSLRIKDLVNGELTEDDQEEGEGRARRVRRHASAPTSLPASLPQGFYKEQALVVEKFEQLTEVSSTPDADFVRIHTYEKSDTKLGFFVTNFIYGDSVVVRSYSDGVWSQLDSMNANTFDSLLALNTLPAARITDIELVENPKSMYTFVVVTVDYELDYPSTSAATHEMDINDPQTMPVVGKSSLFRFEVQGDKYMVYRERYFDTYRAQDATAWVFDNKCFIGIAQHGNQQVQQTSTQSMKIYVQTNPDISSYTEMVLEGDVEADSGEKVLHFMLNGRSYIALATSGPANGHLTSQNQSPVYSYDYSSRSYKLSQWLPTFGATSVGFLSLQDPYALRSRHFLIFTSNKNDGVDEDADAIVYSYCRNGKFIPNQALPVKNSGSVVVSSVYNNGLTDASSILKSRYLQHLVAFNSDGKIYVYQFDGQHFVKIHEQSHSGTELMDIANLGTAASPAPVLIVHSSAAKVTLQEISYSSTSPFTETVNTRLEACLQQKAVRTEQANFKAIENLFEVAPKRSEHLNGETIKVNSLTTSPSSSLTVTNIDVNPEFATESSTVEMSVAESATVNLEYFQKIGQLSEATFNLSTKVSAEEQSILNGDYVLTDRANEMLGNLQIDVVNADELSGNSIFTLGKNIALSDSNQDLETLLDNIVISNGLGDITLISEEIDFEDVQFVGSYDVSTIGTVPVSDFASAGQPGGIDIMGTVTFDSGTTFNDALTIENKVNDLYSLDASNVLLRTGKQTFTVPIKFDHAVAFDSLKASTYNGIGLDVLEQSVNIGENFVVHTDLTVNDLEIRGDVEAKVGVLGEDSSITLVDALELLSTSMKKSVKNEIYLPHNFNQLEASTVTSQQLVASSSWPSEFVKISDTFQPLEHPGNLGFEMLNTENAGKIEVSAKIVSGTDEIVVDANGLDLLLVDNEPSSFSYEVSGRKTFEEIQLKADASVVGSVFGFDMPTLNTYAASETVIISDSTEVESVHIAGTVNIGHLKLNNLLLKTSCSEGCVDNDLTNIYTNGIKRNIESLPAENSYVFEQAIFNENVDVSSLNGVDPEVDFIQLNDDGTRSIGVEFTFKDGVVFLEDLESGGKMKTCAKSGEQSLCKLDNSGECCQPDSEGQCRCAELSNSNTDCVIIHDVNNVDLCQTELMEDLRIIDANSLKSGEVNMISNSVVFKGGVVTRSLDVTNECNLNGVDCTRFVSKIHPETLTGVNTVNGMLIADTTTIQNEITASEIEDVNVNFMYTDSLMKSGYQNVAGKAEFSEEIWVENFISNSVSIGSTNAIDLTDSTPFVLNEPGHVVVCGNLVFSQPISVSSVTTDTYNTVPVQTFFNNLWTSNAQDLSGDIHVTSNVAFSKALSSDDGIPTVNEVDIQALNNLAVGITGDSKITLNNVVAEAVASMHDDVGLLLSGSFLGVDLNDAVLWHSSQAASITGEKRFRNSHIIGNGDFEESTVMSTDQASFVNLDQLFEYMENADLNKVSVSGSLINTNEPLITAVNGENLNAIKQSTWMLSDAFTVDYPITFSDVTMLEAVSMSTENAFINDLDLLHWRDNYMTLSTEQTVAGSCSFNQGLNLNLPVHVPSISLSYLNNELAITTQSLSLKVKELSESVILRDISYTFIHSLITELIFENVDIMGKLELSDGKINNFDIEDIVTYGPTNKVFAEYVAMTGNLNANSFGINNIVLPAVGEQAEEHTGFQLADGRLNLDLAAVFGNGISATEANSVQVNGIKSFSGPLSFSALSATAVGGQDIGNCAAPRILLTEPCKDGIVSQAFMGSLEFGSSEQPASVTVGALLVNSDLVNEVGINNITAAAVLKSTESVSDITAVTGAKSFSEPVILGNAVFHGSVFGIEIDGIVEQTLRVADMSYASGATAPNMTELLDGIQSDVETIKEFVYTPVVGVVGEYSYTKLFSLVSTADTNKFRIAGVSMSNDGGDSGTLNLFELSDSVPNAASVAVPALSIDVEFSCDLRKISAVSVPVSDGSRVMVMNGVRFTYTDDDVHVPEFSNGISSVDPTALIAFRISDTEAPCIQYTEDAGVADIAALQVVNRHCVVLCGNAETIVQCLADDESQFEAFSVVNNNKCYKVDAINLSNDADEKILIVLFEENVLDLLTFYTFESNAFVQIGEFGFEANPNKDNFQLGLKPGLNGQRDRVFIASWLPELFLVHLYDIDTNTFELVSRLDLSLTKGANFYEFEGESYLSVQHGHFMKSTLSTFVFRGVFGFIRSEVEDIELRGVHSSKPLIDQYLQDRYVLTSGPIDPASALPASAIYRYFRKDDSVARRREEFEYRGTLPTLPLALNKGCNEMVHNYLTKRYELNESPIEGFRIDTIGEMALRLMPRQYIEFESNVFNTDIQEYLNDARFSELLERAPSTAAANLYRHVPDGPRTFTDDDFVGTITLFQFEDSLYTYGKVVRDNGMNLDRAISFWSDCSDSAVKIGEIMGYSDVGLKPVTEVDPDVSTDIHQCSVFSHLPEAFITDLHALDNKAVAGAVVVHSTQFSLDSNWFACGMIKNPTQARFQFNQDHPDLVNAKNPATNNHVAK